MVPKLVLFKSHYLEGQSLFALSLFGIISTNMFVGKNACITLLVNMLVGFPLANWFWDIHLLWGFPIFPSRLADSQRVNPLISDYSTYIYIYTSRDHPL